jgi:hypothetical protein
MKEVNSVPVESISAELHPSNVIQEKHSAELEAVLRELDRVLRLEAPALKPPPEPRVRIYGLD